MLLFYNICRNMISTFLIRNSVFTSINFPKRKLEVFIIHPKPRKKSQKLHTKLVIQKKIMTAEYCLPLAAMVAGESLLGVLAGDLIWLLWFWWIIWLFWDCEFEICEFVVEWTEVGLTLGVEQIVGDEVLRYLPSRPRSSLRWCVCWSSLSRILKKIIK